MSESKKMKLIVCRSCLTNCHSKYSDLYWIIEPLDYTRRIESSVFASYYYEHDDMWQIICYPEVEKKGLRGHFVEFGLKLIQSKDINITLSCTFSIVIGNSKFTRYLINRNFSKDTEIMNEDPDLKDLIPKAHLVHNVLEIECIIVKCKKDKYYNEDVPNLDLGKKVVVKNLLKDINSLYMDKSFSDVCLEVQDVKFSVHKTILAARSSVFAAMLRTNMKEKQENVIKIKDIEPEIMKQLISFIYTDHVDNIDAHAIELLKAADMYDLNGLKLLCENSIVKTFTVDNVMELLDIANIYNAENLKKMATNFKINDNDLIKKYETL